MTNHEETLKSFRQEFLPLYQYYEEDNSFVIQINKISDTYTYVPDHFYISSKGVVYNTSTMQILKGSLNMRLYRCVKIAKTTLKIHRLVALAFIPNPKNKKEVNHLKSKEDNDYLSLEWCTTAENRAHYEENFRSNRRYLDTITEVQEICKLLSESDLSFRSIASMYNCLPTTVSAIYNREIFMDISCRYIFPERVVKSTVHTGGRVITLDKFELCCKLVLDYFTSNKTSKVLAEENDLQASYIRALIRGDCNPKVLEHVKNVLGSEFETLKASKELSVKEASQSANKQNRKVTDSVLLEIFKMNYIEGIKASDISKKLNMDKSKVADYLSGRRRKDFYDDHISQFEKNYVN